MRIGPSGAQRSGGDGLRDRLWRSVEGAIDPFQDTDREVLPEDAWRFILYFANQAKGAFVLLLIAGGLAGAVDAAMYWSVGWLIDLLDAPRRRRCSPTIGRSLLGLAPADSGGALGGDGRRRRWSSSRSSCRASTRWCAGRRSGA